MATRSEQKFIDTLINEFQNTDSYRALPPSAKTVINNSVEQYAFQYTQQIEREVGGESNFQIDNIPNNSIGKFNPVNIVSGNLTNQQLTNNLKPSVTDKLLPRFSAELGNALSNNLFNSLPPSVKSIVDFNIVNNFINSAATNTVSNLIDLELDTYSSKVFSGTNEIKPVVADVDDYFRNPETALDEIDKVYSRNTTTSALREASKFNTNSEENNEKLITQTVGFIDPNALYPTKDYGDRAETNKLATGDVTGTIVQKKDLDRTLGIQLPNNDSFEQPPVPFKGEYPYNKVIETESGHVIEMDDTPGAERLQVYHRSGTFVEIDSNGNIVKKTKGSSYEIIDKNGYVSVAGEAFVSVKGNIQIYVGGDANIEVEGDTNVKCFNDITMQAAGRVDVSATEEINLHSANINIEADVNLNLKGDVNAFLTSTNIYNKANADVFTESIGNQYIKAQQSIYTQVGSQIHFQAGSTINADGSQIYLNSSRSQGSASSLYAISSRIGLIGERKNVTYFSIPNPSSPNFLDKVGFSAEDSEFISEAKEQDIIIKNLGVSSDEQINQSAIELESATPRSDNTQIVKPSESLLSQSYLPDNYQLSKNFTLAMVSSKAVITNNPLRAQLGLSYGEIAYNLQGIALNILEPLLSLYPNMFVTSGFRLASNSSSTSDHPRGKAVDIQFKNVSKRDYFSIANKLATQLNYDKLLLEYKTFGTGLPWIHISFDVNRPRKIVLTYFNNKKYGEGLIDLA